MHFFPLTRFRHKTLVVNTEAPPIYYSNEEQPIRAFVRSRAETSCFTKRTNWWAAQMPSLTVQTELEMSLTRPLGLFKAMRQTTHDGLSGSKRNNQAMKLQLYDRNENKLHLKPSSWIIHSDCWFGLSQTTTLPPTHTALFIPSHNQP